MCYPEDAPVTDSKYILLHIVRQSPTAERRANVSTRRERYGPPCDSKVNIRLMRPCRYNGYSFTGCGAHIGYHYQSQGAGYDVVWCYVSVLFFSRKLLMLEAFSSLYSLVIKIVEHGGTTLWASSLLSLQMVVVCPSEKANREQRGPSDTNGMAWPCTT